jgi:hypothetical protein
MTSTNFVRLTLELGLTLENNFDLSQNPGSMGENDILVKILHTAEKNTILFGEFLMQGTE